MFGDILGSWTKNNGESVALRCRSSLRRALGFRFGLVVVVALTLTIRRLSIGALRLLT